MRTLLQYILRILATLVLRKYNPRIVAITGSVGKTSIKEAVFTVLKTLEPSIRKSFANYNTELGVPLTILAGEEKIESQWKWLKVLFKGLALLIRHRLYPKILVLEFAADRPGDIKRLTEFVKPFIGIVTAIGEIPSHVEFFSGPKAVAREKSILVSATLPDGWNVLNYDDETVLEMKEKSKAQVITYGFSREADVHATNYEIHGPSDAHDHTGISFKLEYQGSFVPVRLYNMFGKQAVYAALAAASCGIALGMNLVEISEALKQFQSPPGRMNMIEGIKNTWIIDDTYNASPLSTLAALETLQELRAQRKIAVLGDMREIGKYTEEAHETIGEKAAEFIDLLFTVGISANFIKTAAIRNGLPEERVFHFDTSEEAGRALQDKMKEGDIVLIKGSRAMHMEKVVLEVIAAPEKASDLLVTK